MGKTQKPLKILVIGREDSDLWNSKDVQNLIEKGDKVERIDLEADAVMGEIAYRTFPKTARFTIQAIEGLRKTKPKPPKKGKGK